MFYSKRLRRLIKKWPGEKTFGVYRFLPIFFFTGAAIEFLMIKWTVGETNFYRTYKRRQVENLVQEALLRENLS